MKITFEVSEIDYSSLVEILLPLVRDKIAAGVDSDALLDRALEIPPSMVARMVDILPQEIKDEFAVMLINKHKELIIDTLTEAAEAKGLSCKITEIEAQ